MRRVMGPQLCSCSKQSKTLTPRLHRTRQAKRNVCVTQCNKWKQLLPRRIFVQQAAADHFSRCDTSRILCGWGVNSDEAALVGWQKAENKSFADSAQRPREGQVEGGVRRVESPRLGSQEVPCHNNNDDTCMTR